MEVPRGQELPRGVKRDSDSSRTSEVREKIEAAIATIASEISSSDGLYPRNGGRLSQAEVCRRAGVSLAVLQGAVHRDTTRLRVNKWLSTATPIRTRAGAQKEIVDRVGQWKAAAEALQNRYHVAELEMIGLRNRVAQLEAEISAMTKGKLTPMASAKGRSR
jgi:hypothetical protein